MASLKEIKGRIGSVKSTLKITSAMKMVASAKLHKAQQAIGNMLPYERQLGQILSDLLKDYAGKVQEGKVAPAAFPGLSADGLPGGGEEVAVAGGMAGTVRRVAVVAFASNSSLCGAFNANAVRKALEVVRGYRADGAEVTVFAVGRKMADAMRKAGFPSVFDGTALSERPDYAGAVALSSRLTEGFGAGTFDRVELVYNHFASTASQPTRHETYLPFDLGTVAVSETAAEGKTEEAASYIVEPSVVEVLQSLLPKVLKLKIYTVLLDTSAAEHAARTVAMQTATDNGNDILQELTLEYNKGRQQKITSEILDIVGGSLQ